ncbi:MAG: MarR family transcriptional regulator [Actinomycetota bacterium]
MSTDDPRWLDEDERRAWLGLAHLSIQLPAALDAQLRRDADIGHFDYMLMAWLSEAEGRTLAMSEMAELSRSSLSRLSHAMKRLEARGWVTRCPDPSNGRVTLATLTEAGYAKVVESAPGHLDAVRSLVFDQLSEAEVTQLEAIAGKICGTITHQSTT